MLGLLLHYKKQSIFNGTHLQIRETSGEVTDVFLDARSEVCISAGYKENDPSNDREIIFRTLKYSTNKT